MLAAAPDAQQCFPSINSKPGPVQVVDSLSGVEKEILIFRLVTLRKSLQPGFTPLVWTSLTISAFLQQAEKVCWDSAYPPPLLLMGSKPVYK